MSKVCPITKKRPVSGNARSYSKRATKRRFEPNLQPKTLIDPVTGQKVRFKKLSTNAIRTIAKKLSRGEKMSLK